MVHGVRGVATIVCGPLTIPDPNPFPKGMVSASSMI